MFLPVHFLVLFAAVECDVAAGAPLVGRLPAHGAEQQLALVRHIERLPRHRSRSRSRTRSARNSLNLKTEI